MESKLLPIECLLHFYSICFISFIHLLFQVGWNAALLYLPKLTIVGFMIEDYQCAIEEDARAPIIYWQ